MEPQGENPPTTSISDNISKLGYATTRRLWECFNYLIEGNEDKVLTYFAPKCRVYNHRRSCYENTAQPLLAFIRSIRGAFTNLCEYKRWSFHGTAKQAEIWTSLKGKFDAPWMISTEESIPPSRSEISFSYSMFAHFTEKQDAGPQLITELWFLPDYMEICHKAGVDIEQCLLPGLLADSYRTQRHLRSAIAQPSYSVFQAEEATYLPAIARGCSVPDEHLEQAISDSKMCAQNVLKMLRSCQNHDLAEARACFASEVLFQSPYRGKPIRYASEEEFLVNLRHTFLEGHDIYYDVLFMIHGLADPDMWIHALRGTYEDYCFVSMATDRRSVKLRDVAVTNDPPMRKRSDELQKPGALNSPVPHGTILAPTYTHTRVMNNYYFIVCKKTYKIVACWSLIDNAAYFAQLQVTPPISTEQELFGSGPAASRAALRFIASVWKGELDRETLSRFVSRSVTNHTVWPMLRKKMGIAQDKVAHGLTNYKTCVEYIHRYLSALNIRLVRLVVSNDMFAASLRVAGSAVDYDFKNCEFDACVYGRVPEDQGVVTEFWFYADVQQAMYQCGARPYNAGAIYQESIARERKPRRTTADTLLTEGNLTVIHNMFEEYAATPSGRSSAIYEHEGRTTLTPSGREGVYNYGAYEDERNLGDYFSSSCLYWETPCPGCDQKLAYGKRGVVEELSRGLAPFRAVKQTPAITITQGPFVACWHRICGRVDEELNEAEAATYERLSQTEKDIYDANFRQWHGACLAPGDGFDINLPSFAAMDTQARIAELRVYPDRATMAAQLGVEPPNLVREGSVKAVYDLVAGRLGRARRRSLGYMEAAAAEKVNAPKTTAAATESGIGAP
eukprot:gnl/Chilomastix_cuspidata/2216.p2 GENE.gnl/Chilomastix_cuspidata/2216~~gnl/Chilomastix_cuspidata/2216.p2  ORF type:complete len:846 (+),score=392.35 gnl/Chilomastix_cuspidata/2216:201-2738(+)